MDTNVDRRNMLCLTAGGLAIGAGAGPAAAAPRQRLQGAITFGPVGGGDASAALQVAIDEASERGAAVVVMPGRYRIARPVRLKAFTQIVARDGLCTIAAEAAGGLVGEDAPGVVLSGFRLEGPSDGPTDAGLVTLTRCAGVHLERLEISGAPGDGVRLWRSSGRVAANHIHDCGGAAINAGESSGLVIQDNDIAAIANNGIVVWRESAGEDGTQVIGNRISAIRAVAGGSGQNGNGINAFRADHVVIANNTIADCAFSAVRGNSASNLQIIANNCRKLGEVALYAEFAFQGAVIANNLVAGAATGIEVTNFNDGGRLASVQGNVIRGLFRRDSEPVDKRGVGIGVEADTVVSGNTIEGAPTAGIMIGWGAYMRHVVATSNLIRNAAVGIAVSAQGPANSALLSANLICDTPDGAVRLFDHGRAVGAAAHAGEPTFGPAILNGNHFA